MRTVKQAPLVKGKIKERDQHRSFSLGIFSLLKQENLFRKWSSSNCCFCCFGLNLQMAESFKVTLGKCRIEYNQENKDKTERSVPSWYQEENDNCVSCVFEHKDVKIMMRRG